MIFFFFLFLLVLILEFTHYSSKTKDSWPRVAILCAKKSRNLGRLNAFGQMAGLISCALKLVISDFDFFFFINVHYPDIVQILIAIPIPPSTSIYAVVELTYYD